jgi:hypothetical protein
MRRRLPRDLVVVHLVAAVAVGLAWWQLAPVLQYTVFGGQGFIVDEVQTVQVVAGDGTFALLAVAAGVACAAVLLLRGHDGPGLALGVAVGGLLGSLLAWGLGTTLGPGRLADLVAAASDGDVVTPGPELLAYGALLVWPIVSVGIAFSAAWLSEGRPPHQPSEPG